MVTYKHDRSKVDENQASIVTSLRKIPGIVIVVGHDDFLLGYKGKTMWYEVKHPSEISKRTGKLLESAIKPSQQWLLDNYTGHYRIIWELEQILKELGVE
jgi:hypothetical protein